MLASFARPLFTNNNLLSFDSLIDVVSSIVLSDVKLFIFSMFILKLQPSVTRPLKPYPSNFLALPLAKLLLPFKFLKNILPLPDLSYQATPGNDQNASSANQKTAGSSSIGQVS